MTPSSSIARRHVSGLWLGSAVPAPELAHEVAVNPIQWSLALVEPIASRSPGPSLSTIAPSAFGAGFFDDAADVPGSPVLFFTLRGTWDPQSNKVELEKRYVGLSEDLVVRYSGALSTAPDGRSVLTGAWQNVLEGTQGKFACRLEE